MLKTTQEKDKQAEKAAASLSAPLRLAAHCLGAGLAHQLRNPQRTPENKLRVGALGKDVQQVSSSHKVEAREGNSLGLQIVLCTKTFTSAACQGKYWQSLFCIVQAGAQKLDRVYLCNTAKA